jgi:hypothetical protein
LKTLHPKESQLRKARQVALGAALFCCWACHVTSETRIVGTYRAHSPCGTVVVIVKSDHSFVQTVQSDGRPINQLSGVWSLDTRDDSMHLAPFLDFSNGPLGEPLGTLIVWPAWTLHGTSIGTMPMKCPDSSYEIEYVR